MTYEYITPLTASGVSIITNLNTNQPVPCTYTFQVVHIKKGPIDDCADGPVRFKITVSDGHHFIEGLLAYESNWIGSKIQENDIVGLSSYSSVTNSDKALIIFNDLYIKHSGIVECIGQPNRFLVSNNSVNHQLKSEQTPPHKLMVEYNSSPQTSESSSPADKSFTIIDDWMVLASGYVQGIVRVPSPTHITIRTSLPLLFAKENSFQLDKNADLESIDEYTHFVTTTGSCYELGTKNDTKELYEYVQCHISNFKFVLDIPDPIVKYGACVAHVFYATLVETFPENHPNKWVVALDNVEQFRMSGETIEVDTKTYTLARKIYLSLHPDKRRPSEEGERVALLFYGHVTIDPSADRDLDRPYYAQFYLDSDLKLGPLVFFSFNETINVVDFYSKLRPIYKKIRSFFLGNEDSTPSQDGGCTIKKRLFCDVGADHGPNVKKTK